MVIEFSARHFHAPDTIREYAETKVKKFKKFNDRATQCQIILEHEHNEHTVLKTAVWKQRYKSKDVKTQLWQQSIEHKAPKTMFVQNKF